jgi:NAD(P)H-hydrate epimerase
MHDLPSALYRAAQVRELDRIAIQERGIPGYTLMSRAGEVAFRVLRERWPGARSVTAVCGGGNNGGDGYVVARLARQAGVDARVLFLSDPERLRGDAATAFRDALEVGVTVQPFDPAAVGDADVWVDAILGTGLERDVAGAWAEAIDTINARSASTLAIDIPSGLHADRGAVLGTVVRAAVTTTFIGLKQGLFTGRGPDCCGEVVFDDLGVPADIYDEISSDCRLYAGEDLGACLPRRPRGAHKNSNGHVLVIGGDTGMAGAARMAAEAAARCGAGLVSVATRTVHAALQAAARPELMFRGVENPAQLEPMLARATVLAVGPGLGRSDWARALWDAALARELPLVLDADGLNLLATDPRRYERWVLTPHPGEAARLLGITPADVEADRFQAVATLAERFGGICVLKGAGSLIASAGSTPVLCHAGNPGMASGGMGDVLTGVIAGLMAQGLGAWQAARAGTFIHARAGDLAARAGERGLLAMDLMPYLRSLVNPEVSG